MQTDVVGTGQLSMPCVSRMPEVTNCAAVLEQWKSGQHDKTNVWDLTTSPRLCLWRLRRCVFCGWWPLSQFNNGYLNSTKLRDNLVFLFSLPFSHLSKPCSGGVSAVLYAAVSLLWIFFLPVLTFDGDFAHWLESASHRRTFAPYSSRYPASHQPPHPLQITIVPSISVLTEYFMSWRRWFSSWEANGVIHRVLSSLSQSRPERCGSQHCYLSVCVRQ